MNFTKKHTILAKTTWVGLIISQSLVALSLVAAQPTYRAQTKQGTEEAKTGTSSWIRTTVDDLDPAYKDFIKENASELKNKEEEKDYTFTHAFQHKDGSYCDIYTSLNPTVPFRILKKPGQNMQLIDIPSSQNQRSSPSSTQQRISESKPTTTTAHNPVTIPPQFTDSDEPASKMDNPTTPKSQSSNPKKHITETNHSSTSESATTDAKELKSENPSTQTTGIYHSPTSGSKSAKANATEEKSANPETHATETNHSSTPKSTYVDTSKSESTHQRTQETETVHPTTPVPEETDTRGQLPPAKEQTPPTVDHHTREMTTSQQEAIRGEGKKTSLHAKQDVSHFKPIPITVYADNNFRRNNPGWKENIHRYIQFVNDIFYKKTGFIRFILSDIKTTETDFNQYLNTRNLSASSLDFFKELAKKNPPSHPAKFYIGFTGAADDIATLIDCADSSDWKAKYNGGHLPLPVFGIIRAGQNISDPKVKNDAISCIMHNFSHLLGLKDNGSSEDIMGGQGMTNNNHEWKPEDLEKMKKFALENFSD